MTVAPGDLYGPYELVTLLGSGGMGDVWRAKDTRLGRDVALKRLGAAGSPEGRERFVREARVVSRLNHPHIATLFDVGEHDGAPFLVMELLEGETLASRLRRGPVAPREALTVAIDIAGALAFAHRHGVVHRDLKPSNVMLTAGGAKILDFGVAKWVDDAAAAQATLTSPLTKTGTVVGTLHYMAPEQLEGRAVDHRADLFAFGAMLYEMLTGRRAFDGPTTASIVSAILTQVPRPVDGLMEGVPVALEHLLTECLAKDPEQRRQSASDLEKDLRFIASAELPRTVAGIRGEHSAAPSFARRNVLLGALVALVALSVAAGALARYWPRGAGSNTTRGDALHAVIPLPDGERLSGWASPTISFSPDGNVIAYIAEGADAVPRLHVEFLDRGEVRVVPGSETAEGPFFSPDGKWIGFAVGTSWGRTPPPRRQPQLLKYSLESGLTQPICSLRDYFGGTWRADGTIFLVEDGAGGISRVDAGGGATVPALASMATRAFAWPELLPDGHTVLAIDGDASREGHAILIDVARGTVRDLGIETQFARWSPTGHLLFLRADGTLMAVPFDVERLALRGAPVAVLHDVAQTGNGAAVLAVSRNGALLYARGYVRNSGYEPLRLIHVDGRGNATPTPIKPGVFGDTLAASPDGRHAALSGEEGAVWSYDLSTGARTRLAPDGTEPVALAWSTDGKSVAIATETGRTWVLAIVPSDGSAPPRERYRDTNEFRLGHFTADGASLVIERFLNAHMGLWTISVTGTDPPRQISDADTREHESSFSPDGRAIAFTSDATGGKEVFAREFPVATPAVLVSNGGGRRAWWSRDGRSIYYFRPDDAWMRAPVESTSPLRVGAPTRVAMIPDVVAIDAGAVDMLALQRVPGEGDVRRFELIVNAGSELDRLVAGSAPR